MFWDDIKKRRDYKMDRQQTRIKGVSPESQEIMDVMQLVDAFAAEMKRKLMIKAVEGKTGWNKKACSIEFLRGHLFMHLSRPGQEIDVANFCAMLWWRERNPPIDAPIERSEQMKDDS